MFKIAKPFNTTQHRFAVGDDVNPDMITGDQRRWDDLVKDGFIESTLDEKPAETTILNNSDGADADRK